MYISNIVKCRPPGNRTPEADEIATLVSLRGRLHDYHGTPLIITYHPAYLLRAPADKAKTWQDLRLAVKTMEG